MLATGTPELKQMRLEENENESKMEGKATGAR